MPKDLTSMSPVFGTRLGPNLGLTSKRGPKLGPDSAILIHTGQFLNSKSLITAEFGP